MRKSGHEKSAFAAMVNVAVPPSVHSCIMSTEFALQMAEVADSDESGSDSGDMLDRRPQPKVSSAVSSAAQAKQVGGAAAVFASYAHEPAKSSSAPMFGADNIDAIANFGAGASAFFRFPFVYTNYMPHRHV